MSASAGGHDATSSSDRHDVIAEMMRQNQAMMEEMKRHMEAKFEERLQAAVAQMEASRIAPPASVSVSHAEDEQKEEPLRPAAGRTVVRMHFESSETSKPIQLSHLDAAPASKAGQSPTKRPADNGSPSSRVQDNRSMGPSVAPQPEGKEATNGLLLDEHYEARLPRSVRNMIARSDYYLGNSRRKKKSRARSAPDSDSESAGEGLGVTTSRLPGVDSAATRQKIENGRSNKNAARSSAAPLTKRGSAPSLLQASEAAAASPRAEREPHYVTSADNSLKSPKSKNELNKTSGDWENDIARHILSVYASSIAKTDKVTSDATLEFIEGAKANKQKKSSKKADSHEPPKNQEVLSDVVRSESAADDEDYIKLINKKKFHVEHIARIRGGGGRTVVIRGPPKCFPIYFAGSADVFYDWTSLCLDPLNGLRFQAHLTKLKEEGRYMEYMKLVENVLTVAWEEYLVSELTGRRHTAAVEQFPPSSASSTSTAIVKEQYLSGLSNERGYDATILKKSAGGRRNFSLTADTNHGGMFSFGGTENNRISSRTKKELKNFWRQLVLTANAFGTLLLEINDTATALMVLQLAESWSNRSDIFSTAFRIEIRSYTNFTFAYLFYKRGKSSAAMSHCLQAIDVSEKRGNYDLVCQGYLQMSCMYFAKANFIACHESLYKVLTMVEEGSISMTDPSPERLCMVALAYHNLAVVQLKLMCPDAACKSSQNAQKIARLCLSYSNRWLPTFHWTHQVCLEEIEYNLKMQNMIPEDKIGVMGELMEYMYDPQPI